MNGRPLSKIRESGIASYRRDFGVVFQDHKLLFDRSVFHNVALPLEIAGFTKRDIDRRVRAFNPFPCAFSSIEGQRIKIWCSAVDNSDQTGQPGQILRADNQGLLICCGQGGLLLKEIQLAGKSRLAVAEILKSRADLFAVGKQLGQ